MVSLRKNSKGMIAIMDALIFLILLSMVATGMFVYSSVSDTDEPMAKTVTDQLFETEVKVSQLYRSYDAHVEPLYIILAVNMNDGKTGNTESFIRGTMNVLVPEYYGYDLTIEYNGHVLELHRDSDRTISSEYTKKIDIRGAGEMTAHLIIH